MKLHAGHYVVAVMVIFIAIMIQFMVRAYHNQETLVAEDYYARELRHQEQIDKLNNAAALGGDVHIGVRPGGMTLTFPEAVRGERITGELFLMRPSDVRADQRIAVLPDAEGRFVVDTRGMMRGAYLLQLEWNAGGIAYLTEDRVHIP